jgi:hypothetical protein
VLFHEREYTVYAFFMLPGATPPWSSSIWEKLTAASAPVFAAARDVGAVRSLQFTGVAPHMKEVKFGRIAHSSKGAAKWTHDRDGRIASGDFPHFGQTEIWAPTWNACERDNRAPDVFLCVFNRNGLTKNVSVGPPRLSPGCLLAVATDLGQDVQKAGGLAAGHFASILSCTLAYSCERPWGRTSGGGFTNALNDIALEEPFRPPIKEIDCPAETMVLNGWMPFYPPAG